MAEIRPICVPCRQEMECSKNEVIVQHESGTNRIYYGDAFTCRGCDHTIVTNFGTPVDTYNMAKPPEPSIKFT